MENNSKLSTPVAILIVGVIIAGAIIFTKGGNTNNTQTAAALIASADIALKPVTAADDHILGNPNSDIKVIQYSDTECPFCKRYHEDTTLKIESDYVTPGKLSLTYRPLPLVQLHSKSKKEAEALECANELGGNDKFWQYLNKIFEITPSNDGLDPAELPKIAKDIGLDQKAFNSCLSSGKYSEKIDTDIQSGQESGINGTPYTVVVSKDPINQKALDLINQMVTNKQLPADLFTISKDKKTLSFSGALPYDQFVKKFLDLMTQ